MKTIILFSSLLLCGADALSQPWLNALRITFSNDGTNFSPTTVFQDSSGVPSIAKLDNGTLISAFQWFPAPLNGPHWDSIAVKFSYDSGATWTNPVQVNFLNMPANFKRPFDPTVVNAGNGNIRMYFSCGPTGTNILDATVDTYSTISPDGINFTFEQNARFDSNTLPVIDPAVVYFNGIWHYTAPRGAPQDGAFHATSTDGLNFTELGNIPSDNSHQWTGNLMDDGTTMRFYGTGGSSIWWASSTDGISWSGYIPTNVGGRDPAVIKLPDGRYMMILVGMSPTTGVAEATETTVASFSLHQNYPNPFNPATTISFDLPLSSFVLLKVFDVLGREVSTLVSGELPAGTHSLLWNATDLPSGVYFSRLQAESFIGTKKLVLLR